MNRIMVVAGVVVLWIRVFAPSVFAQGEHLVVNNLSTPSAPEINWHDSLESGWRESRATGRPMVIFITEDHCQYCEAMKNSTWCESSVRSRIGTGFVAIRLTPRHNGKTLDRIRVPMYPTTLIGSPAGKVIGHRTGYQPPSDLHGLLSEAGNRIQSRRDGLNTTR